MAGIGFQMNNLKKDDRFLSRMKAFSFSSVVIAGPMFLCILVIITAQLFLSMTNTPLAERELFLAGTLYSFVFSQLITGGFAMSVTRYLGDQLYAGKNENILSSLYGIVAIVLLIGGAAGLAFYAFSPLGLLFKLSSYLFFMELTLIWLLSMYLSSLKNYGHLIKGFLTGAGISAAGIWFCAAVLNVTTAAPMFLCMNVGFFVTILLFFHSIKKHFPEDNQRYFDLLVYIEKYPSLFLIGLLYTIGLYGHIFIVWGSDLQVMVGSTFVMAPHYDVPVFYAYLTILPAIIGFVMAVERAFYEKYKTLYTSILGSSSFRDIKDAQARMFKVLSREMMTIMELQLFFTVCAIALGTSLLPLTTEQIDIFNIVVIGNYFFIMMFIILQLLLYFDDRKGALFIIFSYVAAILTFTSVAVTFGNYGLSCFLAGFVGLGLALVRLYYFTKNFGYYTYCSQPLFVKEEKWFLQSVIEILHKLNGVGKKHDKQA